MDKGEWATACHQAGHAVIAVLLKVGLRKEAVTIIPDQATGNMGCPTSRLAIIGNSLEMNASDRNRIRAEEKVQVLLAGEIAERRDNPGSVRHYHGESDRAGAINILSYFTAEQRELEAWLKLLQIRTENLLSNPDIWRAVERLATALIERWTIPGGEATEIINRAFRNESVSLLDQRG